MSMEPRPRGRAGPTGAALGDRRLSDRLATAGALALRCSAIHSMHICGLCIVLVALALTIGLTLTQGIQP